MANQLQKVFAFQCLPYAVWICLDRAIFCRRKTRAQICNIGIYIYIYTSIYIYILYYIINSNQLKLINLNDRVNKFCEILQVACQSLGPLEKGGSVLGVDVKVKGSVHFMCKKERKGIQVLKHTKRRQKVIYVHCMCGCVFSLQSRK